jgi:hypothetical protein
MSSLSPCRFRCVPGIALAMLLAASGLAQAQADYRYERQDYRESVRQSDGSSWSYSEKLSSEERRELKQQLRDQWERSHHEQREYSSRSWSGERERMSAEDQEEMRRQLREQHYGNLPRRR